MIERKCKCCRSTFKAREADVKRGWAKFCSKSCKATQQERRTGQHQAHRVRQYQREFGGEPQFHHRTDEYEGFTAHFSNEEHNCNKD